MASEDTSPEAILGHANRILQERGVTGRFLTVKIGGSIMYDLTRETSDVDLVGVFAVHNDTLLGMDVFPMLFGTKSAVAYDTVAKIPSCPEDEYDHNFHEAGKFCRLLKMGNFTTVEYLYAKQEGYVTEAWCALVENRHRFVTKATVGKYIGYVRGYVKTFTEKPHQANPKKLTHVFRILLACRSTVDGNGPVVAVPEGAEREFIMSVKNGEHELDALLTRAREELAALEAEKPWPNVREACDGEFLNKWLLDVRHGRLKLDPVTALEG